MGDLFNMYSGSLYNIGKEIGQTPSAWNDADEQDEICRKWGRSLESLNDEEARYVLEVAREIKGKPTVIIAKTIKGKGVSFMENQVDWHGKAPSEEEYTQAMKELS